MSKKKSIEIKVEKDLVAHKLLNCIDWVIWNTVFNSKINKTNLKFFNNDINLTDISEFSSDEEFYCYLIASKGVVKNLDLKSMSIKIDHRKILLICAIYNKFETLSLFEGSILVDLVKKIVDSEYWYQAYLQCTLGNIEFFESLYNLVPIDIKSSMLKAHDYLAFRFLAEHGDLDFFQQRLYSQASNSIKKKVVNLAFATAIKKGNLEFAQWIYKVSVDIKQDQRARVFNGKKWVDSVPSDIKQDLLKASIFGKYADWAETVAKHLEVVKWLYSEADDNIKFKMLYAKNYCLFLSLAKQGKLAFLKDLYEYHRGYKINILYAKHYGAFHFAAEEGHLEVVKWLYDLVSDDFKQKMLSAGSSERHGPECYAFIFAAIEGHLEVVQWLYIEMKKRIWSKMFIQANIEAFHQAVSYGRLKVAKWLHKEASDFIKKEMLACSDNFNVFTMAAYMSDLEVLQWLYKEAKLDKDMLKKVDVDALYAAARGGNVKVLKWLHTKVAASLEKDKLKEIIYRAFKSAFKKSRSDFFKLLCKLAPAEVECALLKYDSCDLLYYLKSHDNEIVKLFLDNLKHMQYVESRQMYGKDIYSEKRKSPFFIPYITEKIQELKKLVKFCDTNADIYCDIGEDACKHALYILRNLIKRNKDKLLADINFLLDIPGVKKIAHLKITSDEEENELLRLAIKEGNERAVWPLIVIPKVQELAEKNNFYKEMPGKKFDLEQLLNPVTKSATTNAKPASAGKPKHS